MMINRLDDVGRNMVTYIRIGESQRDEICDHISALFRLLPRATLLVGCHGSHGHIRIPLDVLHAKGKLTIKDS